MRINEKTLLAFANTKPVDKEGYLMKRGEGRLKATRKVFTEKVEWKVNYPRKRISTLSRCL